MRSGRSPVFSTRSARASAATDLIPHDPLQAPVDAGACLFFREFPRGPATAPTVARLWRCIAMAADSRLRVKKIDTVTHIEFVDRSILDEANIQKIGEEIAKIIEADAKPKLLISFANVDHLSSSALSMLIAINSKMKAPKNGELRLANIDPQLYEVFVITRLNKLFKILPTTEEAMKSLA